MEEGVVNETLSGPLRDIFDCKQLITDVSGCGNNWYIYPTQEVALHPGAHTLLMLFDF
jgi:hypothetical protein